MLVAALSGLWDFLDVGADCSSTRLSFRSALLRTSHRSSSVSRSQIIQLLTQISQQAVHTFTLSTKITPLSVLPHLHPTPPFLSSYLQIPFYWDLSGLLSLFMYKARRVFPLLLATMPIYGRELAQFPISLLFFPDVRISMSLLRLSLPSQWICSSEDQSAGETKATSCTHFSLSTSLFLLSPHPSFSLHSTLGPTWRHPGAPCRFRLGRRPRCRDDGIWRRDPCFPFTSKLSIFCFCVLRRNVNNVCD